jgi:hypothetical protein
VDLLVEWRVLSLILILLVMWLLLGLLLAAWTLFFQGYIYSEPVSALYWRAPAAAAALTLFLCIWVALDYRSVTDRDDEGRYQPLHNFSYNETITYDDIWIFRDGKKEHYERKGVRQYQDKKGKALPTRPGRIIASRKSEGGKEHVFEPNLDDKKNFKVEKDQTLRYYDKDDKSRYMVDSSLGQVTIFHFGWLVMNLLLNFGFLIVWFLSLWLLLRFQWAHALGLAFVFWLVTLFILPMILTYAESVRKERLPAKTTQTVSTPGGVQTPNPRLRRRDFRSGQMAGKPLEFKHFMLSILTLQGLVNDCGRVQKPADIPQVERGERGRFRAADRSFRTQNFVEDWQLLCRYDIGRHGSRNDPDDVRQQEHLLRLRSDFTTVQSP